ncbi:hypothetical protein ES703_37349 [subsurface metagenome]
MEDNGVMITKIVVKLQGEDQGWKIYKPDQPQFIEAGKQYEIVFDQAL